MDAPLIYLATLVPVAAVFVLAYRRDTPPPEPDDNDTTPDS